MQTQLVFAMLATSLAAAAALEAADDQRPRATTITVAKSGDAQETDSAITVAKQRQQSPMPAAKARTARPPKRQTSLEFVTSDRSMDAWIKPAMPAADTSAIATDQPALRIAGHGTIESNAVFVTDAPRMASKRSTKPSSHPVASIKAEPKHAAPQTRQDMADTSSVVVEEPSQSPPIDTNLKAAEPQTMGSRVAKVAEAKYPTPASVEPVVRPNESELAKQPLPAQVTSKLTPAPPPLHAPQRDLEAIATHGPDKPHPQVSPIVKKVEAKRLTSASVEPAVRTVESRITKAPPVAKNSARLLPAAHSREDTRDEPAESAMLMPDKPWAEVSPVIETAESDRPMAATMDPAVSSLKPLPAPAQATSRVAAKQAPAVLPKVATQSESKESLAPVPAPMVEAQEPVAASTPGEQVNSIPRRFPARVSYRAPDVTPSPNRGYFVPHQASIPFGGHGHRPGATPVRTARGNTPTTR
jgi:hypothetical protein